MFRRFGVFVLAFAFILAILPVFYASADESALAVYTLYYQISTDNGSTWSDRSIVLNYDTSFNLYSNQKIRLTGLNIKKFNNGDYPLFFFIQCNYFTANSSFNITSGSSRFYTFSNGIWGYVSPYTYDITFNFSYSYGPYSSGTYPFDFIVSESSNYYQLLADMYSYVEEIDDTTLSIYDYLYNTFRGQFDNIWTILTQTNYTYLSFAGNGAGLSSAVVKNPLLAINGQLSALVRYFNKIQKNDYSYDSISYDSDGIGTTTSVSSVPWFDAMLGQLKGSSAIEQHHMEMENEALEAGAGDLYDTALSDVGDSYGAIGNLFGLNALRSLFDFSEWSSNSLSIISGWFTQENSNYINGEPGRAPQETVADFVSQNFDLDWFGDHDE